MRSQVCGDRQRSWRETYSAQFERVATAVQRPELGVAIASAVAARKALELVHWEALAPKRSEQNAMVAVAKAWAASHGTK